MIVCPKCGNQAEDDAIFCDQCGTRLKQEAAAPAKEPAPAAGALICPSCGASNVPGEMFCENCGARLEAPQPEAAAPMAATPAPAPTPAPMAEGAVICPACGATAAPDDDFCYVCGADLRGAGQVAEAVPEVPVAEVPKPAPNTCPSCGASYKEGADFCEYCGAALTPVETAPAPAAAMPSPVAVGPRLIVAASGAEIPLPSKAEILIGREDPISRIFPDIDLTPHGGDEGGVSRRHCRIMVQGNQYTIEDLNSTNYTLLNRQRLEPGRAQPLKDGDEIRAGRVRLIFRLS